MTSPRLLREEQEKILICDYGVRSADTKGRLLQEEECPIRTCFQRDVDRIIHCKAFRRLKHKTQVFLQPEGDHYRTRLTHTLEVSRLSRTVSRALLLNEDLTEAISLGHDIGHTPFGHAGERALNKIFDHGFRHYEQSLRVVDHIEREGQGLNLCHETRMGILNHTHGAPDDTCEATIVRLCDRIAYVNHDLDDALRAGILSYSDVPDQITEATGSRNSQRINAFVTDLIESSGNGIITLSPDMKLIFDQFHKFMYEAVYYNPVAKGEESKVEGILGGIADYYRRNPGKLPQEYLEIAEKDGTERAICDYIAGMTDSYVMEVYGNIFIPASWTVK